MSPNNDSLNEQPSPEKDDKGSAASETRVAGIPDPRRTKSPAKRVARCCGFCALCWRCVFPQGSTPGTMRTSF